MTSHLSPVLFAPVFPQIDKPLMVMLPGLDGTSKLFVSQVRSLSQYFDVRCLEIPEDNRQDWPELAGAVVDLIREVSGDRLVYLCGESFGACLALQVALLAPSLLSHLVLINTASALRHYTWIRWATQYTNYVPDWLYRISGAIALPLLANFDRINEDKRMLLLRTVRPISQACVAWRIDMLHRFEVTPKQLANLSLPTSLLASQSDRLFPSDREAQLLSQFLPNAQVYYLPKSGHVCLLEDEVDLSHCLKGLNALPVAKSTPSPASR